MIDESNLLLITDYCYLKREIIIPKNEGEIKVGGEKKRRKVTSIVELKKCLEDFVSASIEILKRDCFFDFEFLKRDLLIEQLVYDVLFDKYLNESEKMTLYKYATKLHEKIKDETDSIDNIRKRLEKSMKQHYELMKYSKLREETIEFGINLDKYDQYYMPKAKENSNKKKPKFIWDYLYYNRNMITYRQYRRELIKNGNYSYERIIEDLNDYNKFVERLLPVEEETPKKYFHMSMDYYVLETYKRIDFILKVIKDIPEMDKMEIDREYFLIKRFTPIVLTPYEDGNELQFTEKCKYYRPLLFIEKTICNQMKESNEINKSIIANQLLTHNFIRAKAYELFKYHVEYDSTDYRDIKGFIKNSYNMRRYHEENEIWKMIKNKSWKEMDENDKRQMKTCLKDFVVINDALFWKSTKRNIDLQDS